MLIDLFNESSYILILKFLQQKGRCKSVNLKIPDTISFNEGIGVNYFTWRDGELNSLAPRSGFSNLDIRKLLVDKELVKSTEKEQSCTF